METTYYTLVSHENSDSIEQVCGGEDRHVSITQHSAPKKLPKREDNVISMADYLSRHSAPEPEEEIEPWEDFEEETPEAAAPRPRTDHRWDPLRILELGACLVMVGIAIAACVVWLT